MGQQYQQIRVADRQTLADIAMQQYGDPDGLFLLLADNSDRLTSLSDVPSPGMVLNIRTPVPYISANNQAVALQYSKQKQIVISGAETPTLAPWLDFYVTEEYVLDGYIIIDIELQLLFNIMQNFHH